VNAVMKECLTLLSTVRYTLITYLLNATVLLEKVSGFQLVKKFHAFYGNRRFITSFTRARHLSLSHVFIWLRLIKIRKNFSLYIYLTSVLRFNSIITLAILKMCAVDTLIEPWERNECFQRSYPDQTLILGTFNLPSLRG